MRARHFFRAAALSLLSFATGAAAQDAATRANPAPAETAPVLIEVMPPATTESSVHGIVSVPTSVGIPFADLPRYIGHRITLRTTGGRLHHGVVDAANAREITLKVRRGGGSASYRLRREQVARVDPG